MSSLSQTSGCLYIVATPIGNLGDMTYRAVETLKTVDLIACEDTRVSRHLLDHFGITTRYDSYNDHNAPEKRPFLLSKLEAGASIALVSDAGTPLISDPGYKLVTEAVALGVRVIPLPGASSVMAALSVSGLPTDRFLFAGFVPTKSSAQAAWCEELSPLPATLVCFESARRLPETLAAIAPYFAGRETVVARELTKLYEECVRGTIEDLAAHYQGKDVKGEVVLLIAPPLKTSATAGDRDAALRDALKTLSVRDAAAQVASDLNLPRKQVYARAVELTQADGKNT